MVRIDSQVLNHSKIYIIDASIVVKWFIGEVSSDIANKVRDDFIEGNIKLHAPDLLFYEVINALIYSSLFSDEELMTVNESLDNYTIQSHEWNITVADIAIGIAFSHNCPIYDAYYLALAIHLDSTFITADVKFYNKFLESEYLNHLTLLRNYQQN